MNTETLKSFKQHLLTLEYLKELTFKYDETNEELTAKEWETIKAYQIDKRKWKWGTANEYWDSQIETIKRIINKNS